MGQALCAPVQCEFYLGATAKGEVCSPVAIAER